MVTRDEVDWELVSRIEKDILYLYYLMIDYPHFMADSDYALYFPLPYWKLRDYPGIEGHDQNFIWEGCLVLTLAMLCDRIEGSGNYVQPFLDEIQESVSTLSTRDNQSARLVQAVKLAAKVAQLEAWTTRTGARPDTTELDELVQWVRDECIGGFFRKWAD